ncbi:plasmid stabilization protein [Jiella sp. KSK16Y-1]|uniref:Plasmid stabilization protein n=2 Tax=Jiella mangrovi TaxID=2821407 RepID=A0ABS4BD32_9HYPH|nr:plasmid stabilization protein [Jiella mangrovi]
MAQITIRKLSDEIHRALKAQAAHDGISAEEKARRLLAEGLFPPNETGFGDRLRMLADGVDLEGVDFDRDRTGIEGADFS